MRIRYGWELALAALLVIEIVAFGAINPRMLDLNMLLFSTSDFICIGIVALPLTMVIVSGGIDISFGSTIGLCAIALGVLFQSGVPMPLAILLTLLLGALCGLINAGLIIYTKVNPLVITLGTLYLFAGSALLLSGMAGATGYEGIGGFPMAFTDFANLDVLGLPVPLIIFLICLLVFWLWLHKTHAGRNVFLIGQSPRVALYSAIPVNRTLCAALCHDGAGVCGRRCAAGIVFWFSTFRSRCVVSDARHHRRGAWRCQYLWWFRFHYRHRHCGFISGIFATRFANGRSAKSGVQRPFRCATYRRCRRSFR